MMKYRFPMLIILTAIFVLMPKSLIAEDNYSPYFDTDYPDNVFWGDTHLHSSLSIDAYWPIGSNNLGPDRAYKFAKGEAVQAQNGMMVKRRRPLDFLVIADHARNMGTLTALYSQDTNLIGSSERMIELSRMLRRATQKISTSSSVSTAWQNPDFSTPGFELWYGFSRASEEFQYSNWRKVTALADQYNEPGIFTAFIGYEWTPYPSFPVSSRKLIYDNDMGRLRDASKGLGMHRVVIFKDGADKASQVRPFSAFDSEVPEDLWEHLAGFEERTGGDVLAIPHNGNLTQGTMFSIVDSDGNELSKTYAATRSRWEPIFEVTQSKGDSETHPYLSPTDEFADFETWDGWLQPSPNEFHRYEYARSALKLGLGEVSRIGVNPFKFGMIGSTDNHLSLALAEEGNFFGKTAVNLPSPTRAVTKNGGWEFAATGYAAVWAKENTRQALFAAMKRKEVYASIGPRITVRFFRGWDYQADDAFKPDLAKIGYDKGVPMGGDLTNAPIGEVPKFLIRAVKDPDGANLDRVQVIKGWHDANGELHEKIYNVALSGGRKENRNGKVKPVGSTVDIPDASYTNSIGDPELATVWQDPDFNKDELAFYYVRVLEIPTPRWTAYDVKFFGLKDIPEEVPMVTQERAYTSPIWYSPSE